MRTKTFRYTSLIVIAAYIDGFVDCLRSEGKVLEDASYVLGYIDMGKDIRVLAIDEKLKTDYDECPITIIAKDCLQPGELEQMCEIRMTPRGGAN